MIAHLLLIYPKIFNYSFLNGELLLKNAYFVLSPTKQICIECLTMRFSILRTFQKISHTLHFFDDIDLGSAFEFWHRLTKCHKETSDMYEYSSTHQLNVLVDLLDLWDKYQSELISSMMKKWFITFMTPTFHLEMSNWLLKKWKSSPKSSIY